MGKRLYPVLMILFFLMAGCAGKEQVYQGIYEGFGTVDQQRQAQDPSYDPLRAREHDQPSYQEYKREREEILDRGGSSGDEAVTD